jgi:hypothetical protein
MAKSTANDGIFRMSAAGMADGNISQLCDGSNEDGFWWDTR